MIYSPESCPIGKTFFYDDFVSEKAQRWDGIEEISEGVLYSCQGDWLKLLANPIPTKDEQVEIQLGLVFKFRRDQLYNSNFPILVIGDNSLSDNYLMVSWFQSDDLKYYLRLSNSNGDFVNFFSGVPDNIETSALLKLRIYENQIFAYINNEFLSKISVPLIQWDYFLRAQTNGNDYSKIDDFYIVGNNLWSNCLGVIKGTRLDLESQAKNLKNENIAPDAHIDYSKLNIAGKISNIDLKDGELHTKDDTTVLVNRKVLEYTTFDNIPIIPNSFKIDFSSFLDGQNSSLSISLDEGFVVDLPYNRVTIKKHSNKNFIDDGYGHEVYGRLFKNDNLWEIFFYSLVGATEVPYTFVYSDVIDFILVKRTNLKDLPETFIIESGIVDSGNGNSIALQTHIESKVAHEAESIAVSFIPENYVPNNQKVESHLNAIDQKLSVSGGNGVLGVPSDGTFSEGLLDFTINTKVKDAIDDLNEVLGELAPPPPNSLTSTDLQIYNSSVIRYNGYLSGGNAFYEENDGAVVDYIINNGNFILQTDNNSFNWADLGSLKVQINGVQVDSFDLVANFNEVLRNENQSYTPILSENGFIKIVSVGKFNNFKKWQKGVAQIIITAGVLRQGYNSIKLIHELSSGIQETNEWKLFYDNDSGSNPSVGVPSLQQERLISTKYLSGVRFYSIDDEFILNVIGYNLFNNVYVQNPLMVTMPGISTVNVSVNDSNVSPVLNNPPLIGDVMNIVGKVLKISQGNVISDNLRVTVTPKSPYGNHTSQQSVNSNILLNTYGNISSDLVERFVDERYRLPDNDGNAYPNNYNSVPSIRTGRWSSAVGLTDTSGEAQVFNGKLIYPKINFAEGYLPEQAVNYSTFTGEKHYLRTFYKTVSMSSGILTINGLSLADIQSGGRAKVEIKLPSLTGWLDLGKSFDAGTFNGINGDGCRTGVNGFDYSWSSGSFSTASSGYMIIVRISIFNVPTLAECTYMELK